MLTGILVALSAMGVNSVADDFSKAMIISATFLAIAILNWNTKERFD